jgi:putative ABC transport system permease protein
MFKNILVTAIRNLRKRKFYTLLNVLGLATSMAFSFLLWLYVQDQVSYDQHFSKAERIYRVNADFNMNEKRDIYSNAPRPVAPTLKTQFPEVEDAVRIRGLGGLNIHTATLVLDDVKIKSKKIFIVDSTYFNMFEQEFIIGNPETSLKEPNSIVLSQSFAKKNFGEQEPYGKSLEFPGRDSKNLKVTGIIKDPSDKTHLQLEALVSWSTFPYEREMSQWYGAHTYTYIMLNESNDPVALHDKFPDFFEQHMKGTFDDLQGTADLMFQPLTEIHLGPEYVWEPYPHGSETNVSILSIIIAFLLVLASINYVNLATAYATERASEVGIRKVLGSSRPSLLIQFLGESILITILSGVVAIIFSIILLPYFNHIANLNQSLESILSVSNIGNIMLLSLAIGVLAGIYPSIHLSSVESLAVLKSKYGNSGQSNSLRKLLVIIQYTIAAMLISGILFVSEQTRFIKNKDVGFEKENLVHISIPGDTVVANQLNAFKVLLTSNTNIVGATNSRYSLDAEANQFTPTLESLDGTTFQMGADVVSIDYDFVSTIGLSMVEGRNFDKDSGSDEDFSVLINETAVKRFGWEESPLLGKMPLGEDEEGNLITYSVVGVVNDFNLGVSYQEVNPLIMFLDTNGSQNLYLKIKGDNLIESISFVKETWKSTFPEHTLEYSFVDETLDKLYKKEDQFLSLLTSFSFIIIFIASLGIIGLISFTTELKKKEIAIRKVNGASPKMIISLLSKKIAGLVLIANLIAVPFTYFFIQVWLENFAHRIDLNFWPFAIALFICVLFTTIALIYHTTKAALANPVYALHDN